MKTIKLIIILLISINYTSFAQDIIYKVDNSTIEAKVKEVSDDKIKYNRIDNLDGPIYSIDKAQVLKIVYSNGHVDIFQIKNDPKAKIRAQIDEAVKNEDYARASKLKKELEALEDVDPAEIERLAKVKAEQEAQRKIEREKQEAEAMRLAKEREARRIKDAEARRIAEEEYEKKRAAERAEELRKLKEPRKHTAYGEVLGLGGFLSINYQPRIFTSKSGVISFSGRIGLGMSNKSIHIPHGFILGIGSQRHQFEIGLMGVFIGRMAEADAFNFLYGGGKESRYTVSPQLGYRMYAKNGFTFNVNLLMIYSEDAYQLSYTTGAEPGITPWFGIGLGYSF